MLMSRPGPPFSRTVFRWVSGANLLLALALGVVGALMGGHPELRRGHALMATLFLGTSLATALVGMRYGRRVGRGGLVAAGFGLFLVGVAQYGLGEASLAWPHVLLGSAIVLGSGVLFVRSMSPGTGARRPVATDGPGTGGVS